MFGHPGTHLQFRFPGAQPECQGDANVLATSRFGVVGGADDSLRDVWVVDVDGNAILITAGYDARTPPEIQQELYEIVDSIEFVDLE